MNFLYRLSIKKFLVLFILSFTIIPCALCTVFSYLGIRHSIERISLNGYLSTAFGELEKNTNILLEYINFLIGDLSNQTELYSILMDNTTEYSEKKSYFDTYFENLIYTSNKLHGIEIITSNGTSYRFTDFDADNFHFSSEYLSSLSLSQLSIGTVPQSPELEKNYIYFCKKIYNYKKSINLGSIIVYLDSNAFDYFSVAENYGVFFPALDSKILYHSNPEYINSKIYIPKKNIFDIKSPGRLSNQSVVMYKPEFDTLNTPISIYCALDDSISLAMLKRIMAITYIMLIVLVAISITIAFLTSKKLLTCIINLNNNITNFITSNAPAQVLKSYNEINNLAANFNYMILQINNLVTQVKSEKELQKNLEINLLQFQINPHFIYNILDIIAWEAKSQNQDHIDDMICSLANYLRIGLHRGQNVISVNTECEHVKKYAQLESYRFPDLFDIHFDISENILNMGVPKIILQPIVENCIRHGFKNIHYRGIILITGMLSESGDIIFTVKDNGVGIPDLRENEIPVSQKNLGGYGLYNVNERLKLYWGSDYGIKLESEPGKGTVVILRVKPQPIENK
ncbi:MAG: histidine kinase [Clostridia bacterium]|nr:histidine kinase [Clostridia bacterium]